MGKPRLIILIRHAQSEGNKNRDIHQTIPDHRVKLTTDGWQQAYEAGRRLRQMLRADDTLHFFTSPYRRTRETTEGILATLTSDENEPSPFKRNNIKVYEEPRLREQDFGNFQPCSAEMERMWQERADYGHFFYRIPNGESAADAYDRVSGFNESLWRQFGENDFASVCVLVTHGLMSRVFLMKWYHFSVEYFEDLRNVNHCEFLIMRKQEESGKYILENKLRTWSELRREKALKEGAVKENGTSKDSSKLDRALNTNLSSSSLVTSSPVEPRRRWGGCPNGCNHDKTFRIRSTLADLVKSDSTISNHATNGGSDENGDSEPGTGTNGSHHHHHHYHHHHEHGLSNASFNGNGQSTIVSRRPAAKRFHSSNGDEPSTEEGPTIDVTRARDEVVSSPDGTPSFISVEDRLRAHLKSPNLPPKPLGIRLGRDFGGTYSGQSSAVNSDADSSEDDRTRRRMARLRIQANGASGKDSPLSPHHHQTREQSSMGRGARANRLGDAPHSSDGEHEADAENEPASPIDGGDLTRATTAELDLAEKVDRSLEGSVY
ncbi:phosphoglycerate mutase-like protein [Thozetella sp. PMI_491]|nr:phosphoglycerate mutase-like protein [Thozetella sp. PMI_491]